MEVLSGMIAFALLQENKASHRDEAFGGAQILLQGVFYFSLLR